MAHLEHPAHVRAARQRAQQAVEPVEPQLERRGQLDEHGAECLPEGARATQEERERRAGLVQPLDVGEGPARLDGEGELRRGGGGPGPERGRTRQAVEGTVELHGVEARRIVRQPQPRGQRARIEARPPVAVDVAAGADEPTSHCSLSSWGPRNGPQTPNVRSARRSRVAPLSSLGAPKWPPNPQRSERPGEAVSLLYRSWGAPKWPPNPQRSERPGEAVSLLYRTPNARRVPGGP